MSFLGVVGCGLVIAVACGILKEGKTNMPLFLGALGGVMLTAWGMTRLASTWEVFALLGENESLSPYTTLLLKALGVGYVVKIGSDVCRDLGAQDTAEKLELCGKAELLLMAMPLISELISLALTLVEESL